MKHILLTALLILSTITSAHAKKLDHSEFAKLPILHEGRIKPLDSFARIQLTNIADKTMIDGLTPIQWLAETLFDPATEQRKIIRIDDPKLREQLALPADQKIFSLFDLHDGLNNTRELVTALIQKEDKDLDPAQQQLIALHERAATLHTLHRSLSLIMPLDITIPAKYGIEAGKPVNILTLTPIKPTLIKDLKRIIKRKGQDPKNYSASENQTALLAYQLNEITKDGARGALLKIIPPTGLSQDWISPWQQIQSTPENTAALKLWQNIAAAYTAQDPEQWNNAIATAQDTTASLAPHSTALEIFYNKARPFHLAMALYGLSLLFCFTHFLYANGLSRVRPAAFWPQTALGLAVFCNIAGIIARMLILDRPPVSTLYESTIFVAAICGLFGFIIAQKQNNKTVTAATAVTALALLTLAPILIPRGESMEMLVAVLNTNFWLATHVVCITMGYGICILSAGLAHIYLTMRANNAEPKRVKNMLNNIYTTALGALLLTTVGTVLGGIWADQSWGRFWGWDPKENGALLIVLWLIWALHGRLSKHLRPLAFAAAIAALNIIVAIAWFGVNLLNTGLHSYGFTSGMATGLAAFCTAELTIIAALYILARKTKGESGQSPVREAKTRGESACKAVREEKKAESVGTTVRKGKK